MRHVSLMAVDESRLQRIVLACIFPFKTVHSSDASFMLPQPRSTALEHRTCPAKCVYPRRIFLNTDRTILWSWHKSFKTFIITCSIQ